MDDVVDSIKYAMSETMERYEALQRVREMRDIVDAMEGGILMQTRDGVPCLLLSDSSIQYRERPKSPSNMSSAVTDEVFEAVVATLKRNIESETARLLGESA